MKPSEYFKHELIKRGKKKFNVCQKHFATVIDSVVDFPLNDREKYIIEVLADVSTTKGLKLEPHRWSFEVAKKLLSKDEFKRACAYAARNIVTTGNQLTPVSISIDLSDPITYVLSVIAAMEGWIDDVDGVTTDNPFHHSNYAKDYFFMDGVYEMFVVGVHCSPRQLKDNPVYLQNYHRAVFELASNTDMSSDASSNRILDRDYALTQLVLNFDSHTVDQIGFNNWSVVSQGMISFMTKRYHEKNQYFINSMIEYYENKHPHLHTSCFTTAIREEMRCDDEVPGFVMPIYTDDVDTNFVLSVIAATSGPRRIDKVTVDNVQYTVLFDF